MQLAFLAEMNICFLASHFDYLMVSFKQMVMQNVVYVIIWDIV